MSVVTTNLATTVGVLMPPGPSPTGTTSKSKAERIRHLESNTPSESHLKRDSSHQVVKALISPYRLVWVAVAVAILSPLASLYVLYLGVEANKADFRVIVIDDADNFTIGAIRDSNQTPAYDRTARLATLATLQRSPEGFDHPDLVNSLFYKEALTGIRKDLERQRPNLLAQNFHQKVEISVVQAVASEGGVRKVRTYGQLIRSGKNDRRDVVQAERFKLTLVLAPNPKLGERGQYPYIVIDYRLTVGNGDNTVPPSVTTATK